MPIERTCMSGTTLIELITTLSIIALLSALAKPNIEKVIEQSRIHTETDTLHSRLNYTRSQAVILSENVVICPEKNHQCGSDWNTATLVFVDKNNNVKYEKSDTLIRRFPPLSQTNHFTWKSFSKQKGISYNPHGFTLKHNGSFYICPPSDNEKLGNVLIINRMGRARKAQDTNNNGTVEMANGNEMYCPQ